MEEEKFNMTEKQAEPDSTVSLNKNGEETPEKPVEEETTVEETPKEEKDTPPKPNVKDLSSDEIKALEKQLDARYLRAKEAEKEAKEAKTKLAETKPVSDVDAILEVKKATDGLSNDEITELQLRAKANGVSLPEARKDDNFKIWQEGYNAKVEKEKALNPSTNQSEVEIEKKKTIDQRLQEAVTQKDKEKILNELTYKNPITGGTETGMNPIGKKNY